MKMLKLLPMAFVVGWFVGDVFSEMSEAFSHRQRYPEHIVNLDVMMSIAKVENTHDGIKLFSTNKITVVRRGNTWEALVR